MTVKRIFIWTCDTCSEKEETCTYGFPSNGWSVIPPNPKAIEPEPTLNECPSCSKKRYTKK